MLDCTATYSAQQIAKILRMSKGKVYKLAKSGDMPFVQFVVEHDYLPAQRPYKIPADTFRQFGVYNGYPHHIGYL